jgi:hypothetical protein
MKLLSLYLPFPWEVFMNDTLSWVDQLSPVLFWDVNRNTIDAVRHARWLIERVLEKGQWEDWILLWDNLGKETISSLSEGLCLDPKARNFLEHWLCRP